MNCVPFFPIVLWDLFLYSLFFFFWPANSQLWRIYFFPVFSSKVPSITPDLRGGSIVCALRFSSLKLCFCSLSSSAICSEPSLKPRDSNKPTRQKLPTMQENHPKGSLWKERHTLQKESKNVWNNTTEFKQRACYRTHKEAATPGGGRLQRNLQKLKGYKKKNKMLINMLLNKCKHSLMIPSKRTF